MSESWRGIGDAYRGPRVHGAAILKGETPASAEAGHFHPGHTPRTRHGMSVCRFARSLDEVRGGVPFVGVPADEPGLAAAYPAFVPTSGMTSRANRSIPAIMGWKWSIRVPTPAAS